MAKDVGDIDPGKDMEHEVSLLDYGGRTNENVVYRINENRSGIYLDAFELGGLRLRVKDILAYKPWNFGNYKPGAGQLGVYKLEDQDGKIYFAVAKDYIASEGDWRIMLINIRDSEDAIKAWIMNNTVYGASLAEYSYE